MKRKINLETFNLESGYPWLETVLFGGSHKGKDLIDVIGYMMGMFHCKQCDTYKPYHFKVPKTGDPVKEMTNARNQFWRDHAHGDGRIILFEKDID